MVMDYGLSVFSLPSAERIKRIGTEWHLLKPHERPQPWFWAGSSRRFYVSDGCAVG